jgi:hypothetical protein
MIRRISFLAIVFVFVRPIFAIEIYVDNRIGRDADDGTAKEAREGNTGPVFSIQRAVERAHWGDTIVLTKTDRPYYGSISLTGRRYSGTQYQPFVIDGNGATISGLRAVPPEAWRPDGPKLWKLTLTRKGYYRLLRDGKVLPEFVSQVRMDPRSLLKPGQWTAWSGSLYFRQDSEESPANQAFAYAGDQTGISLHQVSNVVITNVTLQHFRFDGIHAQGLCDGIVLDNVTATENGRAGVVSSGASRMEIFGGRIAGNGRHQLLVLDRSKAIPHDCDLEEVPSNTNLTGISLMNIEQSHQVNFPGH